MRDRLSHHDVTQLCVSLHRLPSTQFSTLPLTKAHDAQAAPSKFVPVASWHGGESALGPDLSILLTCCPRYALLAHVVSFIHCLPRYYGGR